MNTNEPLCKCGKPLRHLDADPDSSEWICRVPDFERDSHVMLTMTRAAMRVELGEANARIAQLEADARVQGEVASSAVRTARGLDKIIGRVQALAAQWREESQTYWADQLAHALDPNDLYPGLITAAWEAYAMHDTDPRIEADVAQRRQSEAQAEAAKPPWLAEQERGEPLSHPPFESDALDASYKEPDDNGYVWGDDPPR